MIKKWKLIIQKILKKLRFELSASNSFLFIAFYKYIYTPQKNSLSEFLDYYSTSKKENDFYVIQIGANDGITHDPIHKFIKRDSWTGVLLEPQSYVHDTFLKKVYKKNTGIHTINAALGVQDGEQTLYKIGFSHLRWATGLASFHRDNVEKAFSSGMVEEQCLKYGIKVPPPSEWIEEEQVMVISPDSILNKYNLPHIDLLQIDVEGFDFEVIKIFDIQKTQPGVIVYEHVHLSEKDQHLAEKHLTQNQYRVKKYGANTVAVLHSVHELDRFFEN
jgi:FkbM family methyltransferase